MHTLRKIRPRKTYNGSQLPLKLTSNSAASILLKSSNWLCPAPLTPLYYLTHHFSLASLLAVYLPTECSGPKHPLKGIFWLILFNNNHPRSLHHFFFLYGSGLSHDNPSRTHSPRPHQALDTTISTWKFKRDPCQTTLTKSRLERSR